MVANDLTLEVQGAPPDQFGLFYYGPNEIESDAQLDEIVHVLPDLEAKESLPRRIGGFAQHFWPVTAALLGLLLFFTWKTYDEATWFEMVVAPRGAHSTR